MARQSNKKRNERLERLLTPWLNYLGISQRYNVTWCWTTKVEEAAWSSGGDYSAPAAEGYANYPYRVIHMCMVGRLIDQMDDGEFERLLLHETLHGDVFWPMRRIINRLVFKEDGTVHPKLQGDKDEHGILEESAVDLLTHWLIRLRDRGGKLPSD